MTTTEHDTENTYEPPAPDWAVPIEMDDDGRVSVASAFAEASKPDMPEIRLPGDSEVTLMYGAQVDGLRTRVAQVRELRGVDEEALAKLNANRPDYYAKLTDMILMRAVESIGSLTQAQTPKELHAAIGKLLMVDRDILFMHILTSTYGDTKEYNEIECPTCGAYTDIEVHIPSMVEITGLPEEGNPYVTVTLRKGEKITLHYPTGEDQLYVYDVKADANEAEQNTFMIERCIETDVRMPKREYARMLSIADRRKIVDALQKGPSLRFKEVEVSCQSCNSVIPFAFGWADLLFV